MTRHTRNRQMVEVNRRNPHKKLMLRHEMSSINVTMESIYREPVVWDLDPNFHTERVTIYIHNFFRDLLPLALHRKSNKVEERTVTVYFFTKKQNHVSGEGRYFNRILGRDKRGFRHYTHLQLPEHMQGIFDKEGYRLLVDHGNGTHSKTY
ncbi:hypothetical protein BUBS_9 [Bacillus phage Bubs]|uniref:Uncharacterized protein n=3 Tax=Wphvirus megatron TaxID=1987728 RepID=A0A173H2A8_9CAUD|nr:hypothetical protein QLX47_gp010 [Bacillus phage Eyuki]YP_009280812.1 hypothetical protein SAGEFAYGE_9 [Bacillus phage SageFayge]YP_009286885.1 hypothetical protein BI006_gp009 [Bacillus phage Nemo]ANI24628.1 hypothetical protein SMUDGE_9 [Bacillus phage Smudge]ASR78491.1 hypothetical protein BUBS_9 [Bacillus phage Bubs]ASR79322.1 hypothetical protein ZAINNY_9 [Bacillus phage Zainny]ALA46568.1 hypothetical protein EYUKI_10 [Bacillus phage Eyuki]AMW62930.1 hypothetical protein SAGEFAYGE_9 